MKALDAFGPVLIAGFIMWLLMVVCGVPMILSTVVAAVATTVVGLPIGVFWYVNDEKRARS